MLDPLEIPSLNLDPSPSTDNTPPVSEPLPSLGNEFISGIPDQDQAIVVKYVKDWDAQVTKRFQSIHDQYAPYKDLGDIEQIQYALKMNNFLMSDPIKFMNDLQSIINALKEEGFFDDMGEDETNEPTIDAGPHNLPEFEGVPKPFVDKFLAMENQLNAFNERFSEMDQSKQQEAEMAQLDSLIEEMHNEHGDFDDEYFLVQLAAGKSPDQAIQSWNNMIEKRIGSQPRKQAPNLHSGPGSVSNGQVDPSKLGTAERIAWVTAALGQQ